jgi:flagellar hook-basal body complex protein FliE
LANFKQQAQKQVAEEQTNSTQRTNTQEQNTEKRFENDLKKSITSIVMLQDKISQSTELTDTRATTLMITALTSRVQKAKEIIGDKDADQDLISSLGRACELQCSNLGGKCWYDG